MTLKEVLKKLNIDVTTSKSPLANQLKCDLTYQNYHIDFDKNLSEVTDDDLYQIGRSIVLSENKKRAFGYKELVQKMRSDINTILEI